MAEIPKTSIAIEIGYEASGKLHPIFEVMTEEEYWSFLEKALEKAIDEKFEELFGDN